MENLLFLALLAVVGLLRWLSQMAEEKRNREAEKRARGGAPNEPIPRAPATTEEERIRKFMEALGVPSTTAPPPARGSSRQTNPPPAPPVVTAPPAAPRKRPVMPVDPFPVPRPMIPRSAPPAPPPPLFPPPPVAVPAETTTAEPPPLPTRETSVFAEQKRQQRPRRAKAAAAEPYEIDPYSINEEMHAAATETPAARDTSIAARLLTAEGARDAIILREIFGPPRSMQPLDLTEAS